ncbi:tRNA 2-thiouridine(34) synthase MnmA [Candidatus Parcubacteria bacterium]|nr:tRNA 2-thiouridine(34) synthase MnmA [Candidatus Parcubacteria bacterium]
MKTNSGRKIVVGLSGGVDSSVSLVLLKKQGWDPIGVSLKLPTWQDPRNLLRENVCCTPESLNIARTICQKLKVPYHIFDVQNDFQREVIEYFVAESKDHKTPNPCIICNRRLKFQKLFEFAKRVGAEDVATGHYARTRKNEKTGRYELLTAKDRDKDQTYALCFLPQEWLPHIIFPLGDYTKEEVYRLAKKEDFDFFLKRPQSQDFCFVAGQSLPDFLKEKVGTQSGDIVDTLGNILGKHQGLHFYTIGQRKRVGLSGGPYFVKSFDILKNRLIVTKNREEISQKEIALSPFNFISGELPKEAIKVMAQVRYHQPLAPATLFPPEADKVKLVFDEPRSVVTPGQFAVFYKGEVCLGGGRILPSAGLILGNLL